MILQEESNIIFGAYFRNEAQISIEFDILLKTLIMWKQGPINKQEWTISVGTSEE